MKNKPLKVIIDPQALVEIEEMCDGDPVEIQKILDEIAAMFASTDVESFLRPVDIDELMEEDPELAMMLLERKASHDDEQTPPTVH
jgi:hypothetical protein